MPHAQVAIIMIYLQLWLLITVMFYRCCH